MTKAMDAKRPPKSTPTKRRRADDERLRMLQVLIALLDISWRLDLHGDAAADALLAHGGLAGKYVFPKDSNVIEHVSLTLGEWTLDACRPIRPATHEEVAEHRSRQSEHAKTLLTTKADS